MKIEGILQDLIILAFDSPLSVGWLHEIQARIQVGTHPLLQGIIPTQGSNPGLLQCRQILYHLSHHGSHWFPTEATRNPFSPCTGTLWGVREAGVSGPPSPEGHRRHLHHTQQRHHDDSLDLSAACTPGSQGREKITLSGTPPGAHLLSSTRSAWEPYEVTEVKEELEELVLGHKAGSF